jgi:predicted metal-dependent hydrolase
MNKVQWERDLVERPFCQQLQIMGWQWLEGDTDVPEFTERDRFREVLLEGRLAAALRRLNLRDGQPWLDDARIARAIRDLEQAAGHRLLEINQAATELLLKGTVVEGLPDWDHGRPQPVKFIDFENPAHNDFLVINQFKVELASGRGHVIPDAVLFVNGIPLAVAEFKSPGIQNPLQEAINQLLRYSNQRRELFPALYTEHEGVERLFHTNQLLIASDFFEARAATVGAPPEAWLEWADTSPIPLSTVAEDLGLLSAAPEQTEAAQELAALGPEHTERAGTPLFFRQPEQRSSTLHSQQVLIAGMLRPAHLLDLIRNFYLGRTYRLMLIPCQTEALRFDGQRFLLRKDEVLSGTAHFRRWYIEQGQPRIAERAEWLARRTGLPPAGVRLRDLGFRWGSCGKGRVLFFNWKLLQLPVRLIDYVVAHELAHLLEPRHTPAFWSVLDRAMPDWTTRREALRTQVQGFYWCHAAMRQVVAPEGKG